MSQPNKSVRVGLLEGFAAVVSVCLMYMFWKHIIKMSDKDISIALIPNAIWSIATYLIVKHLLPKNNEASPPLNIPDVNTLKDYYDKIELATNKLEVDIPKLDRIKQGLEKLLQQKSRAYANKVITNTLPKDADDGSVLQEQFDRIKDSKYKFLQQFLPLKILIESIIEERVVEIEDVSKGAMEFKTEIQRESFTNKLFDYLETVPDLALIQSITWDQDDYFFDYWKSFVTQKQFISRNDKAGKLKVEIQRIFVLKKSNFNSEKEALLRRIYEFNKMSNNAKIKWFFEEDLHDAHLQDYKKKRSSFLLLIDKSDKVKIITENFQPENESDDRKSYVRFFGENTMTIEQQVRFNHLWQQKSGPSYY